MSLPAALVAALADRGARTRRLERLRACGRAWRGTKRVAALHAALDNVGGESASIVAQVIDAARPMLTDTGWIANGIAAMAAELAADPLFEPPFRAVRDEAQQGLVLIDHPLLRITVLVLAADAIAGRKQAPRGPRSIGFPANCALYLFERAAGVELDLWTAAPAGDDFSAAQAGHCHHAGRVALRDGDILELDGAREAWTFARVPRDVLLVQASVRVGGAPLAVEYDAADGRFLSAQASATGVSRMEMIAAMLGRMGRRDALPVLATLAQDGPFALRWSAAREMAGLDAAAALPTIRRLASSDPHGEVRAAARATLTLLAA